MPDIGHERRTPREGKGEKEKWEKQVGSTLEGGRRVHAREQKGQDYRGREMG
jgi:hypothetical protein